MTVDRDNARRSYRSLQQSIFLGVMGVFGATFVGIGGVAIVGAPGWGVVGVLVTLVALFGYVLTFRAARAGVRVGERGVIIMNLARDTEISWEELDRFSVGAHGVWPRIGIAHLRDGSTVALWGIQGPNPDTRPKNQSAERVIDALNTELEHALDSGSRRVPPERPRTDPAPPRSGSGAPS